jgi:hypothetical protein
MFQPSQDVNALTAANFPLAPGTLVSSLTYPAIIV